MNSPTYRFIPAMFRAVMEKRKTQTRRVIVPQPVAASWAEAPDQPDLYAFADGTRITAAELLKMAPYGAVGTVKPVVTAWAVDREWDATAPKIMDPDVVLAEHGIVFNDGVTPKPDWAGKWRPAMFFPKQFYPRAPQARCVSVKVERVQSISIEDAIAEGWQDRLQKPERWANNVKPYTHPSFHWYRELWDSINADRAGGKYAWAQNPLVFATTFELVDADSADFDDAE